MSLATDTSESLDQPSAVPTVAIWRWTVDQYHEMMRTGISPKTILLNSSMVCSYRK